MRVLSLLTAAATLAALTYAAVRPIGPIPPLGALLDPAHGVWAAAVPPRGGDTEATIPGLTDTVMVMVDDRAVPHIYARNRHDAYRALGYVVARDRLFQLELQTRAAAGTLTELVGARALEADRSARRLGMPRSAEAQLEALSTESRDALSAFAAGVNARIDQLASRDIPVEYRLLGRTPARWEPLNTMHLFKRMGLTLAYDAVEFDLIAARALIGAEAADALFPTAAPFQEPIQPASAGAVSIAVRLPPPGAPDSAAAQLDAELASLRSWLPQGGDRTSDVVLGSNNWAVAAHRTAAGHALLAGDPHLELTLPSIWYETHIVVADSLDVYGVTIPGSPEVIIGFTPDVAWTVTNVGADVADFYRETVDDSARPTRYRLDGAWQPLELRQEIFRDPAGQPVATDTVRYTHRGPMRRADGQWYSLRWTVLEQGDDVSAFRDAALARTTAEFLTATEGYGAPAQNLLAADRFGSIALRSTGRYPIRPGDGRGNVIRDGSTRASDWIGWWTPDEYPQAVDPAQGYVASANQQPMHPDDAPRYLGSDWPTPWRAMRINALLRADSAVTPDAMRRYQTDPGSERAERFVPALIAAARARPTDTMANRAAALLGDWDRRYTRENTRAVLFEAVMQDVGRLTWDELRPPGDSARPGRTPGDAMLAVLLDDRASAWWDLRATPALEERDDILREALRLGLARTIETRGEPDEDGWTWSGIRHATIGHLLGLTPFGRTGVTVQGGPGLLNPSSGSGRHGASWRMVVEMGPEVRAWATYPGGQSGNPASPRYDDRIAGWSAGELDTILLPRTAEALPAARRIERLRLTPSR